MSSYEKLKLLIWKNYVVQKRHKWQTVFEIASPVIFSTFVILLRCLVNPQLKPAMSYDSFSPTYFNITGQDLGNLSTIKREGTLAFSPENPILRNVTATAMKSVALDNLGILALFFDPNLLPSPLGYPNAEAMEKALSKPNAMKTILVGVEYPDNLASMTEWPDHIQVTLRFPATMRSPMLEHPLRMSWRTNLLFPLFPRPGPRWPDDKYGGKAPGYSSELFLAMQHSISTEIIKQKTGKKIDTVVRMQRTPQNAYNSDMLLLALENFLSMIILLAFAYTFVNTVKVVTYEKELQLKETMIIMGLSSWLHWTAWFIKQFLFLLISVILMVILFKIPFNSISGGESYAVLTHVPYSVLLFFIMLYVVASLCFSFMVSVFFSRASTAASFMGLAWLTTYSFFMLTQVLYEDISITTKVCLSLISNTAMGYMFQMIVLAEGKGTGLRWSDFFEPVSYHDSFQPAHLALILVFDSILYMLIALYVERIKPGRYGVPLPWYFPFTKSFWRPRKKISDKKNNKTTDSEYKAALIEVVHDEEPVDAKLGVNIKNLVKKFGRKKAVDDLNLRIYQNQITVLLGHNGAGKTTTISMMTGMLPPTSGTAIINGYDIVTQTIQARKSIGICPQHNVLFPDLTVGEHIRFYGRLKGVPSNKIDDEIKHFLELLELEEKRDTLSSKLSGGQKRRLSVGAAMCGSSRVVLLDEPTSGLDPAARRALWDLLQREKKDRTIILTTHFMDEADVLGDRIAIMSGGRLQCVGTPYFLKKHYGTGYKLTIVKKDDCEVPKITNFFRNFVPDITENTNIGSELTYILTNEHVGKFPQMLKEFESVRESLNVLSYGLSITSLEEVFMKVGAEEAAEPDLDYRETPPDLPPPPPPQSSPPQDPPFENNPVVMRVNKARVEPRRSNDIHLRDMPHLQTCTEHRHRHIDFSVIQQVIGIKLLKNHIKAMILKRAYSAKGAKLVALIQCVTPVINIAISVLVSRSWKFLSSLPALVLDLEKGYHSTETLVSVARNLSDGAFESKVFTAYKNYFKQARLKNYNMKLIDIGDSDLGQYYLKLFSANPEKARYENLVGATFAPRSITAWFSNYAYHDVAISLNLVNDALLRTFAPNASLRFVNHPLPYSIENLVKVMATGSSMGFQFAFNIGFCMAFITAYLVLFVVKERESGAKLLQRVSGVRPGVLWTCSLLWDWLWLAVVYLFIIVPLAIFGESTLSTFSELGRVYLVLIVFSLPVISLHYLASFWFTAPATGFAKMCFANMFLGCMPFLIIEVLKLPEVGNPKYANLFDWIFSPLPLYCLSRSFRDMSVSGFTILACDAMCDQFNVHSCTRRTICEDFKIDLCCIQDDPYLLWDSPGIGRYLFMMTAVGIFLFIVLLLLEYGVFKKMTKILHVSRHDLPPRRTDEDDDVAAERSAVEDMTRTQRAQQCLVCKDLTKYYQSLLAVDRISFMVHKGECFGLLGINGAGKTSTFRMLTGDTEITCGDAYVLGDSVKHHIRRAHKLIGYCPQFDALFDNLTARETLRIFCLLRGIPEEVGAARARQLAASLGFIRHFDKEVARCSGGTKRKISTAVALLGDAPLIYLDEPTTGMDPASKRLVWSAVSEAAGSGRSVVLTSHSMEECEALCSRLTVMAQGRLFCLGPLQHLKSKFSQGYTLVVKCKTGDDRDANNEKINEFVLNKFPNSRLVETYLGISTYYLNDASLPWWSVFEVMETARGQLPLEDYSVSQTTLEQVFLKFTRPQNQQNAV